MKATQHSPHPTLSVVDPRALAIRSVAYCQHPDKPDVEPRITRQIFDEVGREVAAWDVGGLAVRTDVNRNLPGGSPYSARI